MHILKVLAIGAAGVYASDYLAGTETVASAGPNVQKLVHYAGPGAVFLLLGKLLHVHAST